MKNNKILIPEGWEKLKLKDLLEYEQPYKYSVETTNYIKNGTPVLTAGKTFILGYTSEINGIYNNLPVIIFDDFTTDSKFVDFPFKVKSSAMKFLKEKQDNKVDLKLIFEIVNKLKLNTLGGDHKRIWISDFSKKNIIIPKSISEQKKIAEILSKVDTAIEQTQSLIAKYRRIKTGLMQDLLTKGIDENGNIRNEKTHKFKDSELGRIPKEWDCVKLPIVASIARGKFTPRPRNNQIYYNGIYPFIQTGDISNCSSLYLNRFTQTLNDKGILVSKKFSKGVIVMTIAANIGDTAILGKEMYLTDSVVGIVSKINTIYLELFLNSIKVDLENLATQSAQKNINIEKLSNIYIKYSKNESEQLNIANKYISIIEINDKYQNQYKKLQSIKTALMQDLLSGKKRVTNLIK